MTVLLIEDNPGDARLVEEMLGETLGEAPSTLGDDESRPGGLRHVSRLEPALQYLEDDAIDVALVDLGLPDSSGIKTLERVREATHAVPVVVLTGLADERVGDRAVQRGAQEYLIKDELTPRLLRRSLRHAIERKEFERTQTGLHRASRDLVQAESKPEVCRLAVDIAVDVLDLSGIGIYLFDDTTNRLRPVAYTDYVEGLTGELPSFGPADTAITWQAFIEGATITYDDVPETVHAHRRDTPIRSGIWIPLGDHGVIAFISEEVARFDQQTQQLADHLAATAEAALDRVEREESLRSQRQELARQNYQLEELNRTNDLIREINQALVRAETRDAIEQAVCDRLAADERFALAWIGETVDDEQLRPRTWAGSHRGYLDAVSLATDAGAGPPAVTAASTEEVTRTPNIGADLRGAPWRKEALARDLQSVISIPLSYNELAYGVLTVFAAEPNTFDGRSEGLFAELGQTIANALNAVETRKALLTDTVVELDLALHEPDDPLYRLAVQADCQIEYDGIVPQSDGTARLFFSTSGVPDRSIQTVSETVPSIQRLNRISEPDDDTDGGERRFEVTVVGPTIPLILVECGAVARSIQFTDAATRVVVELPDAMDVRTFIDRLETRYSEIELIARRDRERSIESRQPIEATLAEQLTDRQLEVLQTAYLSGYFEWPRECTGEEVAASLDITQPTFNGHLRVAERKLFALFFDGGQ